MFKWHNQSTHISAPMDGQQAEYLACQHLKKSGLKISQRNYNTKRGEIDIIAYDDDTLVFVEVRYRKNSMYGSAEESINQRKQQRIIQAAQAYLLEYQLTENTACRFDAVCITPTADSITNPSANAQCVKRSKPLSYHIKWLRNAFQAE